MYVSSSLLRYICHYIKENVFIRRCFIYAQTNVSLVGKMHHSMSYALLPKKKNRYEKQLKKRERTKKWKRNFIFRN